MATFTLPKGLRSFAGYHQKIVYSMMFQCVISTLKDFGLNPDKLGVELGMTAVLHTHSRKLDFHPHIHVVLPGGGVDKRRGQWKKLKGKFLFNEFALASVFRARFLQAIKDNGFYVPFCPKGFDESGIMVFFMPMPMPKNYYPWCNWFCM